MSSLTDIDKRYFEKLFGMQSGYVLDFSDATFAEFFRHHKVDIHGVRYQKYGTSKGKKFRAFWELESDALVGKVLSELLDSYEATCELTGRGAETNVLQKCRAIVSWLAGVVPKTNQTEDPGDFLEREFRIPNIHKLPVEAQVAGIVEARLAEATKALKAGAHLSVIFLCESVLEGVLLGAAQRNPEKFNRSRISPKSPDGRVKSFHEWTLAELIDAACDIQLLHLDVRKFSHGLRDFRNYIHPYQQMSSGFTPDEHTAKVCFQVLKAALASIAGDR